MLKFEYLIKLLHELRAHWRFKKKWKLNWSVCFSDLSNFTIPPPHHPQVWQITKLYSFCFWTPSLKIFENYALLVPTQIEKTLKNKQLFCGKKMAILNQFLALSSEYLHRDVFLRMCLLHYYKGNNGRIGKYIYMDVFRSYNCTIGMIGIIVKYIQYHYFKKFKRLIISAENCSRMF